MVPVSALGTSQEVLLSSLLSEREQREDWTTATEITQGQDVNFFPVA